MKIIRFHILLLGTLVLAAGLCAKDFEGTIRMKMTSSERPSRRSHGDGSMFMNQSVKGGLMRIDTEIEPGKEAGMIIDMAKRETILLMPEQRMYMVMKIPEPKKSDATGAAPSDVEIIRTGETDIILGYKCTKIIVKAKNSDTEAWSAEGLGTFHGMGGSGPMGRPAPKSAWETALAEHGAFPLRMVSRDKSGKVLMQMEVVSITPQSLPDSLFVPPADYQKFEMPSIPGFGGMGSSGPRND